MIDATAQAVSFFEHGLLVHESASWARLLECEPEAFRVRLHAQAVARRAGAGIQESRTAMSRYRLVPSRMSPGSVTRGECVVVTLERLVPTALSDAELRDRFHLTPREVQVARLIAAGHRNQTIADELGMRPNTAWRHTERILGKLGVHNRSAVGPALRA
jgi:DNA-binding CsgD family transcriptional regulator